MSEVNSFGGKDKDKVKAEDEDAIPSPFVGVEKSQVLQEAGAAFNDPQVVKLSPSKCCLLITKLLFLLSQGETFEGRDAETVFFAVTKLFQSQNTALRRMTYLFIKEVAESTDPENVIIVIQSLTKDMNSDVDLYRANAIRVLCKIIDASILGQIERYIKQALVDRNPLVSASALICGNQMAVDSDKREVVRRWVNEVQESVNSRAEMVQYHALALLYASKSHDRLAIGRIVQQYSKGSLNSPLAMCLLVRYTSKLLHEDMSATNSRAAYEFLENCLHHRHEMVIYEAARAMCRLPEAAPQDIMPAITVLQLFLSSPKPSLRFAAVRTLNEVAMKHPNAVTRCNEDMEGLIGDANKSIATLAITTLLKTGSEGGIDKLMKQIAGFMSDIGDEFKIVVVRAVRALCLKYPNKQRVMLNFLSNILREEGGFDFKKVIVDSILHLIEKIPQSKEAALFHLCEFIEDCEFNSLSAQILHVLGEMGPTTTHPAKFIRFIYNRVILENAHVRAAAVTALGKFGSQVEDLTESIIILLESSLQDDDDEVRDRATVSLSILKKVRDGEPTSKTVLVDPLPMSENALMRSLEIYQKRPAPGPLSFDALPVVEDALPARAEDGGDASGFDAGGADSGAGDLGGVSEPTPVPTREENYAEELLNMPEFANLGALFKSSRPEQLTESETEYLVTCVKHIFAEHVIFQFNVTNTIDDQLLKDVSVVMEDAENDAWAPIMTKSIDTLKYNVPAPVYVLMQRPEDSYQATFSVELQFKVLECDPKTGEAFDPDDEGAEEDYPVEDLELGTTDFIARVQINNFKSSWETVGKANEVLEKFELPQYKTLKEAITAVIDFLGLRACEGTDSIPHNADAHNVLLSGTFIGGAKVLARTAFSISPSGGSINLKIAVRSDDPAVPELVMECIQ
ncbi:Coatomer subunit gamma [Hondaea fermentalgiana]|uniref:Coatomer subunit gamma n=1 Tax=Hondaea fermentalgiana TaxID=2315210 RepID=A0A2R5GUB9_9STRA|nr:Coatomer subunit gamma [Hondaea fermentalgiana]|eukprot:GBG34466.1 Coatomer subunit gamma [Hondaea fermentalgiana]